MVALHGLGGAGKTSVAVEYAHWHLAEAGVCWQFAGENPAVLEAEFAVLAARLGVREQADVRDPVASVHAVLARAKARWLVVFDNVPDRASVERACAYMQATGITLAAYLPLFQDRQADLLARGLWGSKIWHS